jgi:hypothetical protein
MMGRREGGRLTYLEHHPRGLVSLQLRADEHLLVAHKDARPERKRRKGGKEGQDRDEYINT